MEVDLPAQLPPEWQPLTWDEVRRLQRQGVEFGAHTVTHPILTQLEDQAAIHAEISVSKQRVEAELGAPVLHFCYPNGKREDIGIAALEAVRRCGFLTSSTTIPGLNFDANPLLLRRFTIDPSKPRAEFSALLSGLFHLGKDRHPVALAPVAS